MPYPSNFDGPDLDLEQEDFDDRVAEIGVDEYATRLVGLMRQVLARKRAEKAKLAEHEGPGNHPGTGTPQSIHGRKGAGRKLTGDDVIDASKGATGRAKVADMVTRKDQPASTAKAVELMQQAASGAGEKRGPVWVTRRPNGSIEVVDGNATTNAAKALGIAELPVIELSEEDAEAYIATAEMFTKAEKVKDKSLTIHNRQKDPDSLFAAANEALDKSEDSYQAVLDLGGGVEQRLGGKAVEYAGLADAVRQDIADGKLDSPVILIAPAKGMARSIEKVQGKYDGDWSRLTDTVRATVLVDSIHDFPAAMVAVREEAAARGWEIVPGSADNKYVSPLPTKYRDASLLLRAPNGVVAELQINTPDMWLAKEGQGHKLYEQYRSLDEAKKAGKEVDEAKMHSLQGQQVSLYSSAYEQGLERRKQQALQKGWRH